MTRARSIRFTSLLLLVLTALPLAGCGAHIPWFHRGPQAPRAPHAAKVKAPARAAKAAHAARTPKHGKTAALAVSAPAETPARVTESAYRTAERRMAADSLVAAEAGLRTLLARDPDDAVALSLLSKLLYRSGRSDEAVTLLASVRERPDAFTPAARRVLLAGLALHEDALGRVGDARAAIAPAREDGDPGVASAAVFVTLRGDAPDSAQALAKEALRHDGHSAVALNNFGITRLRTGDVDAARKAFANAIERDPALPGPYYNLAILEKFYRFDDTAAARWFGAYWDRSHDDPDSLRAAFPGNLANVPVPTGGRP